MKVLKQDNPETVRKDKFTWKENCACGAVLQLTKDDVTCRRDCWGIPIEGPAPFDSPYITCPCCQSRITVLGWKCDR